MQLYITRLDQELPLPTYANPGDAGLDIYARVPVTLHPFERFLMPTGIAVAIPEGYVGLMHPRSGWAIKEGLSHVNAPGTIDAGYRGEIRVPLINLDPTNPIVIERGNRIGQLLIQKIETVKLIEVADLEEGSRNVHGFGSSGK